MKLKDIAVIRFLMPAFIILFFVIVINQEVGFAEPGIKITSPADGSTVNPGETVTVTIESIDGFAVEEGIANIAGSDHNERVTSLPLSFTDNIPLKAIGKASISVLGRDVSGNVAMDDITLKVEQTGTLQSLMCYDNLLFETDWNENVKGKLSSSIYGVYGIYSDGIEREMPKEELSYTSSNPEVVSVDNQGNYQVHKMGEAKIIVSSAGISKEIPLVFLPPRGIRPKETIPPTVQMNIQPTTNAAGWYNKDITITITAQDESGIEHIIYSFPYISAESIFVESNQAVIPFDKEGINLLRYVVYDKERNSSGQLSTEIHLDKTPPQISLASPTDKNEYFNDTVIPLTYTATDALSGIASVSVKLDNKDVTTQTELKNIPLGNHTLNITATDKADNSRNIKLNFVIKLKAEVTIKPEVFLLNKGIFLAFVKFPKGYDIRTITDASCDGAKAKKIIPIPALNSSILIFKREDITQKPIDTTFTVKGHFKTGLTFEGTDTIKKVINLKDFPKQSGNTRKDKEDEDLEIDKALGELLGKQKGNLNKIKEEMRKISY